MGKIPFNKPFISFNEQAYIQEVINTGNFASGNYVEKCEAFFRKKYGYPYVCLTPSCTDALEMASLLINLKKDDEVIVPAYGYVSTANAFFFEGGENCFCR